MPKKKKERDHSWGRRSLVMLQGAGMTAAAAFLLLLGGAAAIDVGIVSEDNIRWLVVLIAFLSAFLSGIIQKIRLGRWTAAQGALSACAAWILFAGLGLLIWKKINWIEGRTIALSLVCAGIITGLLPEKRRNRRRG